jgi:hypothetical protein
MIPEPGPRSALDDHLDSAARTVDRHVADYVTPSFDPAARPRRSSAALATAVAAVLLLVVAIVAVNGGDPSDGEVAADVDSSEDDFEEIGEAVGGPRDGLESLRLPVEVTPSEGLADGQVVTVRGSQFPPNTTLGIVMCAPFEDPPQGAANCRLTPYTSVTSNADGSFEAQHAVDRVFVTGNGEEIDCATTATPCVIAVGAISDYDQSGGASVTFDPAIPPIPDPFATIDPGPPYVDGQVVTVTVGNVAPGSQWWASQCADDGHEGGCSDELTAFADGDGRVAFQITVRHTHKSAQGEMDCTSANVWCSINVGGDNFGQSFELVFGDVTVTPPATTETTQPATATTTTPGTAPASSTTTVPTTTPDTTIPPPTTTSTTPSDG